MYVCSHVCVQQPCSTHRALVSRRPPAGTTRLHRHLHTRVHSLQPVTHVCMHIYICACVLTRACATAMQYPHHSQSPCEPITACWHHTVAQTHTRVHSLQPVTRMCMHVHVCAHTCVCNSHAALTEPLRAYCCLLAPHGCTDTCTHYSLSHTCAHLQCVCECATAMQHPQHSQSP